jgi:hypothetical protein
MQYQRGLTFEAARSGEGDLTSSYVAYTYTYTYTYTGPARVDDIYAPAERIRADPHG